MRSATLRRAGVIAALVAVVAAIPNAQAAWDVASNSGRANSKARTMPGGETPTVNVTGRTAVVAWLATQFPNGAGVDNYEVSRYDANTGAEGTVGVGSTCATLVIVLTCTETLVPPGDWKYAVTPHRGNWVGAESAKSSSFSIAAPNLAFTSPTIVTTLETTLNGTVSTFMAGQTLQFRLDDAASGTVLASTVTPNSIPATGTSAVTVTIPKGTSNGTHTVYAVGNQGDVASRQITVNVPPPSPAALATVNVGQTGRLDLGDSLRVTYSQALDVGSICSTWSGDASNQTIIADNVVTVRVLNNAAAGGNDLLDVTTSAAACGGQFHFGSVNLGSPSFVTGDTTFAGAAANRSSVSWDFALRRLQITLGARTGPAPVRVNTSLTATYTPHAAIRNGSWTPITGTVSNTGVQF